ncbi:MAG TPA: hypothetical protein ENN29_08595 [Candidatus Hydrogenedentes bacterium]|nr:hypothetical protein [Candidatus Hydrogenedentota bacterium]
MMLTSFLLVVLPLSAVAADASPAPPLPEYHLTARPWTPLRIDRDAYLEAAERLCRHVALYQNEHGAIIDPILGVEHQYSTPYFAFTAGALVHAQRAMDLLPQGVAAMEHATLSVEKGNAAIPDQHGEFYLASLAGALEFYKGHVSESEFNLWQRRLQQPVTRIIEGVDVKINNWRAYAMRGEWLRAEAALTQQADARAFIEDGWRNRTQRARMALDRWSLYQDWSSAPQSHAVEAVGRINLLGLVQAGYDGASADEIRFHAERGTATSLLLQDPTGQCPPNGRTDNHVFNDVLYQLGFEIMAERKAAAGDLAAAGQYRRAAMLGFKSIGRWRREDALYEGTYSITKNHFPIDKRVGYQPASNWTNYCGAGMLHLAEAWLVRRTELDEAPAPAEIGGYVAVMDAAFGSVAANAGGMQVFINLRGDVVPKYGVFWTPPGIVRLSRVGWDSRLGPSDGVYSREARGGVTCAPVWRQGRRWTHLADHAANFRGTLDVGFVHPMLVRCTVVYHQETGVSAPVFYQELTITPDGVLSELRSPDASEFGLALPLLQNDGRELDIAVADGIASVTYPVDVGDGDQQNFIAVDGDGVIEVADAAILSSYGYLLPARQTARGGVARTFIYPRNADEPTAREVRDSFRLTEQGFSSVLGRVEGALYAGRTAAGGYGDRMDVNGDGKDDIILSEPCGFIAQHRQGRITAVETDAAVSADVQGQRITLEIHEPYFLDENPVAHKETP